MRILYGVVGEGMGHAMRSRVVIEHLLSEGHELHIMASGRAVDYLGKRFEGVERIHGLHMIYEENRVRPLQTLWSNVRKGLSSVPASIETYYKVLGQQRLDAVITDFDAWTYWFAHRQNLPVLSIDNMQIINRCRLADEVTRGHHAEFELTRGFIKGKLPYCNDYFITTFFHPEVIKAKTRLFPPILRPEIMAANRREGEHLLVYTTGEGNATFVETLKATGLECRIYGMRRDLTADAVEGNLRFRPFSEDAFIDDLASSRAVIAGGGFTLMGEAVALGVPMLSVPMAGQFEQTVNATYLQMLGYGRKADTLDEPRTVHEFIDAIPDCRVKLAGYLHDGNRALYAAVDGWLVRNAR